MKHKLSEYMLILALLSVSAAPAIAADKEEKNTNPSEIMETYLGDVVADAMLAAMGADVALINGGSLGYENLPDKVNEETLPLLVPFGSDPVVTVKLKGADLRAALEKSYALLPKRSSSFLQVSGLDVVCDQNLEPGGRIASLKISGKPLDPKKEYIIATTEFLGGGGGGLTPFRNGKRAGETETPLDEIVLKYIKYNKTKAGSPEGRIVIIPLEENGE